MLIKKNFNIIWSCETRVDNMSEELIKLMSTAGCRFFYLGIESASQKVLDRVNKKITLGQIERVINWCKKYNIKTDCSLIVGTPGETFEDYFLTQKMMDRLKPYSYGFNVFVGIPYSSLYKHILENNLYEYIDDIGLVYLPGYDIKAKFFYNQDSKSLVDYEFKQRTNFDRKLLRTLLIRQCKKKLKDILNSTRHQISRRVPSIIKKQLKRIIKNAQSYSRYANL